MRKLFITLMSFLILLSGCGNTSQTPPVSTATSSLLVSSPESDSSVINKERKEFIEKNKNTKPIDELDSYWGMCVGDIKNLYQNKPEECIEENFTGLIYEVEIPAFSSVSTGETMFVVYEFVDDMLTANSLKFNVKNFDEEAIILIADILKNNAPELWSIGDMSWLWNDDVNPVQFPHTGVAMSFFDFPYQYKDGFMHIENLRQDDGSGFISITHVPFYPHESKEPTE